MEHVDDISAADLLEPQRNPELTGLVWRRCLQLFSLPLPDDSGADFNSNSASDMASNSNSDSSEPMRPLRPLLVGESTLLSVRLWRALVAECEQSVRARLADVEARNGELLERVLVGERVDKVGSAVEHEKGLPFLLSARTLNALEQHARQLDSVLALAAAAASSAGDGDGDEDEGRAAARQSSKQAKKKQQQSSKSGRAKATATSSKSETPFQFDSATHIAQTLKKGHLQDCSEQVVNFLALCLFSYASLLDDTELLICTLFEYSMCTLQSTGHAFLLYASRLFSVTGISTKSTPKSL